jgi:mannose/fructose-specific phosphotransferase system component IIA
MTAPIIGVVVGHGAVAEALVGAAEQISGVKDALVAVTNTGADRAALQQRVIDAVGANRAIVFVDLPSGSCLFAAMRGLSENERVRVVTGVNLVMLLDFLFHREEDIAEVARRAAEAGARSIAER